MAYEETEVLVSKSQEGIRKMIYAHKGTGVSFVSQPPREGFEALVTLDKIGYHIRVMANAKSKYSEREKEQEERRVWRVLFWHLKAMFEAADSGVIAVEDIIMPYAKIFMAVAESNFGHVGYCVGCGKESVCAYTRTGGL
jgi:hypothetical protein